MTKETKVTEAAVVAELVTRAVRAEAAPREVQRTAVHATPWVVLAAADGSQRVESLAGLDGPRKKAHAAFTEATGFCEYLNIYADEHSRVWCDVEQRAFEAVLDYHSAVVPDEMGRRGEHRATLRLMLTEEFIAWQKLAAQPVAQAALAEFLEDHYQDIEEPEGAEILELAKTLEVKNDVAFKAVQRRSDGNYDLLYEERVTARAGQQGQIEVPCRLLLAVQMWQGGAVMRLPVRMRFRHLGGAVAFTFTFIGLERLLRAEFDRVREQIAEKIGRPVWAGAVKVG